MRLFSPVQCVGYAAFVLGVAAFAQKSDRRLKSLNACQSLAYAVHFVWLGNLPASASASLSALRSFLSLRTRSWIVAVSIIGANLAAGVALATSWVGWLTVASSCAATLAIFYMDGVRMRLVLLGCTGAWLINNVLSGSIGGTALEVVIALANGFTIARMARPAEDIGGGADPG
jgi:hypothetical protein